MIVIDYREPEEICLYLADHNIRFSKEKCVIGDFYVNGILLERKTWSDFFTSYGTGHLYKQMLQLHQHHESILILEGFRFDCLHNKESFYTILCTLLFHYRLKIIFTGNAQQTAAFLIALERITRDNTHHIHSDLLPKLLPQALTAAQTKKRILCCFPCIGDIKAQRILEQCPSLRKLFVAPPKELASYGIGKNGQKAFEEILDR